MAAAARLFFCPAMPHILPVGLPGSCKAMAETRRKLTTIMSADVQDYTRLMGADEEGTLATLKRYRDSMSGVIGLHGGRVVNTWGDGLIAEFPSVVEAVQCAVETQQELSGHDRELPEARRMRFRIGINLGDVMVEGADIYGDGVNIAARLQERAEPGGILISGPVYDQVRSKLSLGFDCLGWQQVKNVATPVMSYRVNLDGPAEGGPLLPAVASGVSRADAGAAGAAGVRSHLERSGLLVRAWNGFIRLHRTSATLIAIAGFLVLINIFSGLHEIWFHWAVAPLLLIAVLRAAFSRKSAQ